jgi:hypothetical protein
VKGLLRSARGASEVAEKSRDARGLGGRELLTAETDPFVEGRQFGHEIAELWLTRQT